MLTTVRQRIKLLDATVKRFGWRSLALVGISSDEEVKALLQWCKALNLTAVWDPTPTSDPATRTRRIHMLHRMREWSRVYPRLTIIEAPRDAAAEMVDREFDAVALWNVPVEQLGREGGLWAGRVRDGGCLLGLDHRSPYVRRVLDAAVPKWEVLRDGVWLVKVKRSVAAVDPPVEHVDSLGEGEDAAVDKPTVRRSRARKVDITHDPADSDAAADATIAQKSKGGRPKGSRNKPKVS
jgi:hypothetical protein